MKTTLTLSTLALVAALQAAPAQALTADQLNQISAVNAQIRDAVAQGQDTGDLVAELRSLHEAFGEDFGAFAEDDNPSDRDIVEAALGRDDEGLGDDDGFEHGGEDGGATGDDHGGEGSNSGPGGGEGGDDNSGPGGGNSGPGGGGEGGEGGESGGGGEGGGEGGEGGDD
jgi:hypothetical protein